MSFEFLEPQSAVLTTLTPRTERHGDEDVFAVSFGLTIEGPNTLLDKLSPTLRQALYKPADEATDQLPGVDVPTPLLRASGIDLLTLKGALQGWTIGIEHGIEEEPAIVLGDAKVDNFRVRPKQGGTVELMFRVGSNDIDTTEAGLLCGKLKQEIAFTLKAPEIKSDAKPIDGTGAEFRRDHPLLDQAERQADAATAAFLGQRGDDDGANDPEDADSEGGDTDGSREQAELEAGMAASLSEAGVKPRGGARARKPAGVH
jgi:hypothetical protein